MGRKEIGSGRVDWIRLSLDRGQ